MPRFRVVRLSLVLVVTLACCSNGGPIATADATDSDNPTPDKKSTPTDSRGQEVSEIAGDVLTDVTDTSDLAEVSELVLNDVEPSDNTDIEQNGTEDQQADLCVTDCEGKQCGPDGCGSECGFCPEGHICSIEAQCVCVPACVDKECGDDGCGGSCGECKGVQELCIDGICECQPDCNAKECGPDGCGGDCGLCPGLQNECMQGACTCVPACVGKECGEDGCNGSCGNCGFPNVCADGQCVCAPDCDDKDCGPDELCGVLCGECGCGEECQSGSCLFTACDDEECGDDGCGGSCGTCDDGKPCSTDECIGNSCSYNVKPMLCLIDGTCYDAKTQWPDNQCLWCDPDEAQTAWSPTEDGTPCGDYDQGQCFDGQCQCVPDCSSGNCSNGCGGQCFACDDGLDCTDDWCGTPQCEHEVLEGYCVLNAICIDEGTFNPGNGCQQCSPGLSQDGWSQVVDGTPCGLPQWLCIGGECACQPDCAGKECGPDGCDGQCGECALGDGCIDGGCAGPEHVWSMAFGGSQNDYGRAVAVDSQGNLYLAGGFEGSLPGSGVPNISFSGSPADALPHTSNIYDLDIYLTKLSADGSHLWSKGFGGPESQSNKDEIGMEVAVDSGDNVYLFGEFAFTSLWFGSQGVSNAEGPALFAAKFSPSGENLWAKSFSLWSYKSFGLDGADNLYLMANIIDDAPDCGGGPTQPLGKDDDICLSKLDEAGGHLWSLSIGSSGDKPCSGKSLAVAEDGSVIVTGYYKYADFELGGGTLGYISPNDYDKVFLGKYDADGDPLWSHGFGGSDSGVTGEAVGVDSAGNVYLSSLRTWGSLFDFGCGPVQANAAENVILSKYDENGDCMWSKAVGKAAYDNEMGGGWSAGAVAMEVGVGGDIYLTGSTSSSYGKIFVLKIDTDGVQVWSREFGAGYTASGWGADICIRDDGRFYLTGTFSTSNWKYGLDLGGDPIGIEESGVVKMKDVFAAVFQD